MNCPEWSIRSTRLKRSTSSCARLDALCDRLHVDAVAHLDCRGDYGAHRRLALDLVDEGLAGLHDVERVAADHAKRRVSAAKIVQQDLRARIADLLEQLVQLVVGARAKDVVGNRARRTGLAETHKAPVAFLANLELGAQPRYRVVEADDGVVFVDDVSARRSIAHEPCLRSAAHCLS